MTTIETFSNSGSRGGKPSFVIPTLLNVLDVGDSLTNGNGDATAISRGGWRTTVGDYFNTKPHGCTMTCIGPNDNGFSNGQGKHDGVSGVDTQFHIDQLPGFLTGGFKADFILLMIGTNDCLFQTDKIAFTLSQQAALLAAIRNARPSCRVLMSSMPANSDAIPNSNILGVNAGMPAMIANEVSLGGHVRFMDGYSATGAYNSTPSDWFDGTHFNSSGYEKMAAARIAAIDVWLTSGF